MKTYLCMMLGICIATMTCFGMGGCAVNPVTGKQELMLLSESDEIKMGAQTDEEIAQSYGLYKDEKLQQYLENLGQRLAQTSHRPGLPYRFKVLDSPVVNAFAVPGGYVYVTRGILAYLNNEAELAGVLGHEIGHVTARHSAKQYSRAQIAQLGLGLGSIFSETFAQYAGLAQFGVTALFLRFSRDNERQADQLGVEYSSKVGFDASKMAGFFVTLERLHPSSDNKGLPSWLSTHPDPPDRIAAIQRQAREWNQRLGGAPLAVNQDGYFDHIDGIIYGEDPHQGYVENGIFFHPDFKIQFPVPANWQFNNTPAQVKMVSKDSQGAIVLSAVREMNPTAVAKKFVSETQVQVIISEPKTVNGLSAHQVLSDLMTQQGAIRILSTFIQKGDLVYVFHGYTASTLYPTYQSVFEKTMLGFKTLSDTDKINRAPDRLRILRVKKSGPLKNLLVSNGTSQETLKDVAILNGKELDDMVTAGSLIKIVQREKR